MPEDETSSKMTRKQVNELANQGTIHVNALNSILGKFKMEGFTVELEFFEEDTQIKIILKRTTNEEYPL